MKQQTVISLASLLVLLAPTSVLAAQFYLTELFYHPGADHEDICKGYFGNSAVKADFDIDLKTMSESELQTTLSSLNIGVTRNQYYYFVTHNLDHVVSGTTDEAYFFENNGGAAPSFFDKIDGHHGINLAATEHYGRILCKVETPAPRRLMEADAEDQNQQEKAEPVEQPEKESLARKLRSKLSWGW